ncbi:hypothetical protein SAMN05216452_0101 [Nitratireductor aquibiodomus]|uniref:Uncharacterized protein n=2 Tax=Nitratireductor aquibiodomus TaxID=204799 RepID=A0A1H4IMV0_9HYPH|nr:hypothetical protein SAMN05216452_0101 [Nitratireductor aquibiodomus]
MTGLLVWLAMLPTFVVALMDTRTINGVSVWDKPLKFQFAFGLYLLTLVVYARFLPDDVRYRNWYRRLSIAVALSALAEVVWTAGAGAIGTESHFNSSLIGLAIYTVMGIAAIVIVSASSVYAFQIARNKRLTLSPAIIRSLILGLAMTAPLTLVTAGTIMDGHWVGGSNTDESGLLLLGWVRDGGDLRVAHFFATHALHFVPAFGLISSTVLGKEKTWPVTAFATLFLAFTLWTLFQAHAGLPFLPSIG